MRVLELPQLLLKEIDALKEVPNAVIASHIQNGRVDLQDFLVKQKLLSIVLKVGHGIVIPPEGQLDRLNKKITGN